MKAFIAALFTFVWTISAWTSVQADHQSKISLLDFSLEQLGAPGIHDLKRYEGKPVLMIFFQPECSWCLRQMRVANDLMHQCESGFEAIGVGVTGSSKSLYGDFRRVRADFAAYEASPELLDAIGGVPATPFMLLADSDGNYVKWFRGYVDNETLIDELTKLTSLQCG